MTICGGPHVIHCRDRGIPRHGLFHDRAAVYRNFNNVVFRVIVEGYIVAYGSQHLFHSNKTRLDFTGIRNIGGLLLRLGHGGDINRNVKGAVLIRTERNERRVDRVGVNVIIFTPFGAFVLIIIIKTR